MSDIQKADVNFRTNQKYLYDSSFMNRRIDFNTIYNYFDNFFSCKETVLVRTGETYQEIQKQIGTPKINNLGIKQISHWVSIHANEHTVQANYNIDSYEKQMYWIRLECTEFIILNCYDFEIQDSDLPVIINVIVGYLEKVLTRPIDNKERESYGEQFKSTEVYQDKNKSWKDSIGLFGKKNETA